MEIKQKFSERIGQDVRHNFNRICSHIADHILMNELSMRVDDFVHATRTEGRSGELVVERFREALHLVINLFHEKEHDIAAIEIAMQLVHHYGQKILDTPIKETDL